MSSDQALILACIVFIFLWTLAILIEVGRISKMVETIYDRIIKGE